MYTLEEAKQQVIEHGLIPDFEHYPGQRIKVRCITPDGYYVSPMLTNLKRGKVCEIFHPNNPDTIKNIQIWLRKNNKPFTICENQTYVAQDKKLKFICPVHGEFLQTWVMAQRIEKCLKCHTVKDGTSRKKYETDEDILFHFNNHISDDFEYIDHKRVENGKIKVLIKCLKHNHDWWVFLDGVVSGRIQGCKFCKKEKLSGSNCWMYNPDLSDDERRERRKTEEYYNWRTSVFIRDNHTCVACNKKIPQINAHHLDGWHWCKEKRYDIDNGVTLCKDCHTAFHVLYGRKNNTKEQFEEFMQIEFCEEESS